MGSTLPCHTSIPIIGPRAVDRTGRCGASLESSCTRPEPNPSPKGGLGGPTAESAPFLASHSQGSRGPGVGERSVHLYSPDHPTPVSSAFPNWLPHSLFNSGLSHPSSPCPNPPLSQALSSKYSESKGKQKVTMHMGSPGWRCCESPGREGRRRGGLTHF